MNLKVEFERFVAAMNMKVERNRGPNPKFPIPTSFIKKLEEQSNVPKNVFEHEGLRFPIGYENRPRVFGLAKFEPLVKGAPKEEEEFFMTLLQYKTYNEDSYRHLFKEMEPLKLSKTNDVFIEQCDKLYGDSKHVNSLKLTPEHLNRGGKKIQTQYFQHQAEAYLRRYVQVLTNVRNRKREVEKLRLKVVNHKEDDLYYTSELAERTRRLEFEKEILGHHEKYLNEIMQLVPVQKSLKNSKDSVILKAFEHLPLLSQLVGKCHVPEERKKKLVLKRQKVVPKTEPPFQILHRYTEYEFYSGEETCKPELEAESSRDCLDMKEIILDINDDLRTLEKLLLEIEKSMVNEEENEKWSYTYRSLHVVKFVMYEALIDARRVLDNAEERLRKLSEYRQTQLDILKAEYSWLMQLKTNKQISEFPPIFVPFQKNKVFCPPSCSAGCMYDIMQVGCMVDVIKLHLSAEILEKLEESNDKFRAALEISDNLESSRPLPVTVDTVRAGNAQETASGSGDAWNTVGRQMAALKIATRSQNKRKAMMINFFGF